MLISPVRSLSHSTLDNVRISIPEDHFFLLIPSTYRITIFLSISTRLCPRCILLESHISCVPTTLYEEVFSQYRRALRTGKIGRPMMNETLSEMLLATEVAQWLRVRPNTIYAWAATGHIPSVRLNGTVRFIRADIQRWVDACSKDHIESYPSPTRPIVPLKPRSTSRETIQRAGARAIRRFLGGRSSQANPNESPQPVIAPSVRKDRW